MKFQNIDNQQFKQFLARVKALDSQQKNNPVLESEKNQFQQTLYGSLFLLLMVLAISWRAGADFTHLLVLSLVLVAGGSPVVRDSYQKYQKNIAEQDKNWEFANTALQAMFPNLISQQSNKNFILPQQLYQTLTMQPPKAYFGYQNEKSQLISQPKEQIIWIVESSTTVETPLFVRSQGLPAIPEGLSKQKFGYFPELERDLEFFSNQKAEAATLIQRNEEIFLGLAQRPFYLLWESNQIILLLESCPQAFFSYQRPKSIDLLECFELLDWLAQSERLLKKMQ